MIAGQVIPSGLHYRINLETGLKEAKLLDEEPAINDTSAKAAAATSSRVTQKNLEKALENIPADIYEYSKQEMAEIKSKFRTYDTIKSQLKDVNINVRTDFEILTNLLQEYDDVQANTEKTTSARAAEIDQILEDIAYLVHQVDNAVEFVRQNGLEKLILPSLNRTNSKVKIKSLQIIGTALQNNPAVQIACFERNLAEHLTRFLTTTKLESEISAGFFAFGALIRRFPVAQQKVLTKSVFNVLFDMWTKDFSLKMKVKVLTFLTDLLMETNEARTLSPDTSQIEEKIRQYALVNLERSLQDFDFCSRVERFVVVNKMTWISNPDHTERMIGSLNYASALCKERWSDNPDLRHVILVLRNRYAAQVADEKEGADAAVDGIGETSKEHLLDILVEIERLYAVLFDYLKEKYKDEL